MFRDNLAHSFTLCWAKPHVTETTCTYARIYCHTQAKNDEHNKSIGQTLPLPVLSYDDYNQ